MTKTQIKSKTALLAVAAVIAVSAAAVGIGIFGGLPAVVTGTVTCGETNETLSRDVPAYVAGKNPLYFNPAVHSTSTQYLNGRSYGAYYGDTCLIDVATTIIRTLADGTTTTAKAWQSTKVDSCSKADEDNITKRLCRLQEGFCTGTNVSNYIFFCPNGCSNGACVTLMNVSVSPTPASGTVMAGTQNYTFANLGFDAANAPSDLKITQVKLTIATGNGGAPANLSNSTLWDGTTQLATTNDPDSDLSAKTTPGATATALFTLTSPLTIVKGTTKILTYKANIASGTASGAEFSAGLQPGAEPVIKDIGGKTVYAAISYAAGQKMTVASAGTLTLSSATSPSDSLAAGGQTEEVFKFTLAAAVEDMTITQGYVNVKQVNSAGGIKQISELKIYDGPTLVASGIATSTDNADRTILVYETSAGSWALTAGQVKTYTVKATTRIPDYYSQVLFGTTSIASSGQAVDFSLKAGDLTVNGAFSGELGAGSKSGAADANNFYVFKSIPKFQLNDQLGAEAAGGTLPQSGLSNASLYKFKVTAIGADVGLYNFTFYVSTTTATVTQLYSLYDSGTPVAMTVRWLKYLPENGIGGAGVLSIILNSALTVQAGTTKTLTLKANIVCQNIGVTCGAAAGSGSVAVSMLGNTAAPGVGMQIASALPGVNQWNTVGVGGASFLWTDYWRTYSNASTTSIDTEQWWNGYRVRDTAGSLILGTSTSAVWSR